MESLINAILSYGGSKERLEIKLFGGGNVTRNSSQIGTKNAEFVRQFLRNEGYIISGEDMGGNTPRRVQYHPYSGKVLMRKLQRQEDFAIVTEEENYKKRISVRPAEGSIDLF
jgi:chemotaxis protein CheD